MNENQEVLTAMAEGFAAMQRHVDEKFGRIEERFQKMEDRQLFLERKIDNRFDLLERMMTENRRQDNLAAQELGVRVSNVETAGG